MRSHGSFLLALFLVSGSAIAFGQSGAAIGTAPNLSVSYVEGAVYQQSSSVWKALSIGDWVSSDASIRLEAGACVQLKGIGSDIYLSQKGTYAVRNLLAVRQKMASPGIGTALLASLASLFARPQHNQSSVAGTRGATESENANQDWMGTGAEDDIQQARDDIQSGKYEEAIKGLTQTLGEATEEEIPQIHYYLAYAYSLSGDTPDAERQMAGAKPSGGDFWAGDYILLQAKLCLDTFAFAQAVQWLTQPENDLSRDAQRASLYYFLLGLGYRGFGDEARAAQNLSRVVSLAGESELGKSATRLLQNQQQ